MDKCDEMYQLVDKLNYYTKLYDEGNPAISDQEWDNMYFELRQLEQDTGIILANSPSNHIDYQVVNKLEKVTHNHPMLSLDKTKDTSAVLSFLGNHDGIAMAKIDGLTCSILYQNGKLVRAETRGNGLVGEDVTHNILFVKGIPQTIPFKDELIVDGEIICTYNDFEAFSAEYKNPRNFASGSIRLLDAKVSAQRKLTFVVWDCIKGIDCNTLVAKIIKLETFGFITVPHFVLPNNTIDIIQYSIDSIKNMVKELSYPIDGLVFKYNDCNYYQSLGATNHHFRGGLAYKFYDEEYETILKDIEWSMGKTGQLTPVAVFEPIDDGDSVITRASLHNLNIMEQVLHVPFVGQKIKVVKQNMIIPQVVWGEKSEGQYYSIPAFCPICESPTVVKDDFVYCTNPHCEGKFINQLVHFTGKKGLDIKGLSEATLEKLVEWEWVTDYFDLFNLDIYKNEWINMPGFGEKSVNNLLTTIQEKTNCELWQFIAALSIPLIGTTYAKEIAKRVQNWEDFRKLIDKNFDFTSWDRFGYEMDNSLNSFDYDEADLLVEKVLHLQNSLWVDPNATTEVKESAVSGKVFVVTGAVHKFKNRDEVKAAIEAKGGKVTNSVTGNTNYLINNDINSTSSKNVKAKQLGVPIITEDELIAML